jgi:hypothetical protein
MAGVSTDLWSCKVERNQVGEELCEAVSNNHNRDHNNHDHNNHDHDDDNHDHQVLCDYPNHNNS